METRYLSNFFCGRSKVYSPPPADYDFNFKNTRKVSAENFDTSFDDLVLYARSDLTLSRTVWAISIDVILKKIAPSFFPLTLIPGDTL